jgi:hypothetical protein
MTPFLSAALNTSFCCIEATKTGVERFFSGVDRSNASVERFHSGVERSNAGVERFFSGVDRSNSGVERFHSGVERSNAGASLAKAAKAVGVALAIREMTPIRCPSPRTELR